LEKGKPLLLIRGVIIIRNYFPIIIYFILKTESLIIPSRKELILFPGRALG